MSASGGGSESSNSSRPLTAAERTKIFQAGLSNILNNADQFSNLTYQSPTYVSSGEAKTLTNGDYDALQSALLKGTTAGLDYSKNKDVNNVNNDAAKRGIWSSGLAMQGINDVNNAYSSAYEKAGADATQQRYNLQANELNNLNNYNQTSAAAENAVNMENANRNYNSSWAPYQYLMSLYNGTGGQVSSGSSSGLNWSSAFNI